MRDIEKPLKISIPKNFLGWISKLKTIIIIQVKSKITALRSISAKSVCNGAFGYLLTTIVAPFYPLAVFLILVYFFAPYSHGGAIRRAEATEDRPTVVRLAKGRRTAIHFWEKPEKVIPGSPSKIQIDFLGNDVTVSPLANDPGNLLVYARGTRFVVLFQMASEANYDDVVQLVPGRSKTLQAIRLDQDTYHLATFKITRVKSGVSTETQDQVLLKDGGKLAVIDDVSDLDDVKRLSCGRCVYSKEDTTLVCPTPIEKVECHGGKAFQLTFAKVSE